MTAKFTLEVKKKRKAALLVLYLHTTVGFLRFLWECGPGMLCIRELKSLLVLDP
jgi:hypothetical protein